MAESLVIDPEQRVHVEFSCYYYSYYGSKWDDNAKLKELNDPKVQFIYAYDRQQFAGFVSFMFTQENDIDDQPRDVVYIYEIQIKDRYRGKGYGSILVKQIEKLACGRLVMLSCYLKNYLVLKFYKKHGFKDDPISPTKVLSPEEASKLGYTILFKKPNGGFITRLF